MLLAGGGLPQDPGLGSGSRTPTRLPATSHLLSAFPCLTHISADICSPCRALGMQTRPSVDPACCPSAPRVGRPPRGKAPPRNRLAPKPKKARCGSAGADTDSEVWRTWARTLVGFVYGERGSEHLPFRARGTSTGNACRGDARPVPLPGHSVCVPGALPRLTHLELTASPRGRNPHLFLEAQGR